MKIEISSVTKQAQDSGADFVKVIEKEGFTALLLADGAGGVSGAKEASALVISLIEQMLERGLAPPFFGVEEIVRRLDKQLLRDEEAGLSTLVAVFIFPDQFYGVSVGDSKCWHYTGDYRLELTAHQYKKPLLGSGEAVPVGFGPFQSQGRVLVGSDGLFDYAEQSVIDNVMTILEEVTQVSEALSQIATKGAEPVDDLSLIACHMD